LGFALTVLGVRLWAAQRRILTAIATERRVAIASGQKLGKSTAMVIAALWWACTRKRGRVLLTGAGNEQVRDVLWKELRRICYDPNNFRGDKRRVVDVLGIEPALMPHTGMQWPDGREIIGYVKEGPTATQGFSSPEMLIVIDEACGVEDDIFEAHEGNTAAGGRILASSNPTKSVGWFFDAFHDHLEFWEQFELSSEDSPNITGSEPAIPGLAGPEWRDELLEKYGRDGPAFQVRVLGKFAGTATNTIIGTDLLKASHEAYEANKDLERDEPLEFGVDVARFGDDSTSIAPRRGRRIYPLIEVKGFDNVEVAEKILQTARELRRPGEVPSVKIDCTGGHGTGPADILRAGHSREVQVVEVNASSRSDDEETYVNLRAQMHFGVAVFLKDGGELPPDKRLDVELLSPTYTFDARRRFVVEPKDKIKQRLKRSPDRADAVALAVYRGVARAHGGGVVTRPDFDNMGLG
jgi:phage terminase large subunit